LKVSASNLHLWLMELYRILSPKKIYFFNPFFVIGNPFRFEQTVVRNRNVTLQKSAKPFGYLSQKKREATPRTKPTNSCYTFYFPRRHNE